MSDRKSNASVESLNDQLLLQQLINTYHWRADQFDWEGWAATFTEDSVFEFVGGFGTMTGRQQIHDTCKGNMDHVYEVMQHVIVNLDFELTGTDTATGHGNLLFSALPDASKPTRYYQSGGRYEWQFRRTAQGWRIAHTRLQFLWNNGLDQDAVFESRD